MMRLFNRSVNQTTSVTDETILGLVTPQVKENNEQHSDMIKRSDIIKALSNTLDTGDCNAKMQALSSLRKIGTEEAIRAMMAAVNDADLLDQLNFELRILGAQAAPAIELMAQALCGPLKKKGEMLNILINLHNVGSRNTLLSMLDDQGLDIGMRKSILTGMATLEDECIMPYLIQLLGDANPATRSSAIMALGYFKSDSVVELLRPFLIDSATVFKHQNHKTGNILVHTVGQCARDALISINTPNSLKVAAQWGS
jgi:HEAT repeat protein